MVRITKRGSIAIWSLFAICYLPSTNKTRNGGIGGWIEWCHLCIAVSTRVRESLILDSHWSAWSCEEVYRITWCLWWDFIGRISAFFDDIYHIRDLIQPGWDGRITRIWWITQSSSSKKIWWVFRSMLLSIIVKIIGSVPFSVARWSGWLRRGTGNNAMCARRGGDGMFQP